MNIKTNLSLAACGFLLLCGCDEKKAEGTAPKPRVEGEVIRLPADAPQMSSLSLERAESKAAPQLEFTGRVVWDDDLTVRVYPPFAGRVSKIIASPGQVITAGAPLAVIASPDYGQAQTDAQKASSDFTLAERNLNRMKELFEHGAAPKKELDSAEAEYARAASEKARTLARLALYGGKAGEIDQVYQLQSPLAGVVVEKNINPGQEVRPDQMLANVPQYSSPLFVISDPRQMWVYLDVTEECLPQLREGQQLTVKSRAYPGLAFEGRLEIISDVIDPVSRAVRVRGVVQNGERVLKSDMFVTVSLEPATPNAIQVPAKAVFLRGDHHYVYVARGEGQYSRQEVRIGSESSGRVQVLSGLSDGAMVVTEGSLLLQQMQDALGGA